MAEFLPWLPAIVALIAAVAAVAAQFVNRGGARRARREPTWVELLNRVTALEGKVEQLELQDRRKMGAVLRILRQIANQWPSPAGPDLDPDDIALIEETIPPQWVRRPSSKTKE